MRFVAVVAALAVAATARAAPAIDDGTVLADDVVAAGQLDATEVPGTLGARIRSPVPALGLRVGDLLVAFQGEAIRDAERLGHVIDYLSDHRYIYVEVVRGGAPPLIRRAVTVHERWSMDFVRAPCLHEAAV